MVVKDSGILPSVSDNVTVALALLVLVYWNLTSPIEVVSLFRFNVISETVGVGAAVVVVVVVGAAVVVVVVGAAVVVVVVVGAAVVVVVVVVAEHGALNVSINPSLPTCIATPELAAETLL